MREHRIETFDGVPLAWFEAGDGPPVVLINGIGVDRRGLEPQVAHLAKRFRVLLWDYRGVGASGPIPYERAVSMAAHASDLLAVLRAAGVDRAAVVGWSMGVHVALELLRHQPEVAWSLVLCCGASSALFEQYSQVPGTGPVARGLLGLVARAHRPLELAMRMGVRTPLLLPFARGAGLVSKRADQRVFEDQARSVAACDMRTYLGTMVELLRADCDDVLPRVRVPTLLVAGEADRMVRLETIRKMADRIADAEVLVVPRSGHYCLLEEPELINERVERHLDRCLQATA